MKKYYLFYEQYFSFWNTLCEEDKAYLCENSAEVHFEKEQMVHNNFDCNGLYIVKNGRLRLYMLSEDGKEITLYRLSAGEICMLSASCVLQSITFEVYVEAEVPSDCYKISANAFRNVSERVPAVKIFALEAAVQRFSDVMWIMQQIVFMSMDKRLAIFLLEDIETIKYSHGNKVFLQTRNAKSYNFCGNNNENFLIIQDLAKINKN